jgi:hypothetical protein
VIFGPTGDNGLNEHKPLPLQISNSQECNILCVRFQNFTVVTMKITAFWHVTPCNLVDRYNVSHESTASIFRLEEGKLDASFRNYALSHPRKPQFHNLHEYTGASSNEQDQSDHIVVI